MILFERFNFSNIQLKNIASKKINCYTIFPLKEINELKKRYDHKLHLIKYKNSLSENPIFLTRGNFTELYLYNGKLYVKGFMNDRLIEYNPNVNIKIPIPDIKEELVPEGFDLLLNYKDYLYDLNHEYHNYFGNESFIIIGRRYLTPGIDYLLYKNENFYKTSPMDGEIKKFEEVIHNLNTPFGKLEYDLGFKINIDIQIFNIKKKIVLKLTAYNKKDGLTLQQLESIRKLKRELLKYVKIAEDLLNKESKKAKDQFTLTAIVIERNGEIAFLLDDSEDLDNGIAITLFPKVRFLTQDEYL